MYTDHTHRLPTHIWTTLSYMYRPHTGFPSISGLPCHTCTQTTHRLPNHIWTTLSYMYTDHTQASHPYLDYPIIHVHRPHTGFPSISGLPYHTCTQTIHRLPTHIWTILSYMYTDHTQASHPYLDYPIIHVQTTHRLTIHIWNTLPYMYTDHTQASNPYLDYPIIHVHRPHTGFPPISGLPYHTCTQTTHRLPIHIWTTLSFMYTEHTQASHPFLAYPIIHVHRPHTGFPPISGLPYHTCTQTTHRLPTLIWTTLSYMYTDHTQASHPYLDYPIIHVHRPHTGFPSISGLPYHNVHRPHTGFPPISGLPYHTCTHTTHRLPINICPVKNYPRIFLITRVNA